MSGKRRGGERDDDFLEVPAAAFAASLLETGTSPTAAQSVQSLQAALGDRYRIDRELGRGGMATVYLAYDAKHARRVALKVLHADAAPSIGAERFTREITTAAGLSHPHILPLFDSGSVGGLLYYTMPYVEGESLKDRLERERQLPVPVALGIAREVTDALAYAHARGVIHRDIKPANIMLADGHALVTDFGIARALGVDGVGLTQPGIAVGTPACMSPEQGTGEHAIDGRSDIYSLGCVLYEVLAGEPPFTGSTAQAIITKRMTGPPPRIRRVRPNVGEDLDATLARAMAPLAADRFQTADELLAALTRESPLPSRATNRLSKARVAAAIGGVVAVMAIASAIFLWRNRPTIAPSAASIVVLPLTPVALDTALTRLGRELTITLSTNLDGVGGIRVVDALGVLANIDAAAPAFSPEQARAFARRLGAKSIVRGTLIRVGDSVQVDVVLHPTACATDECREPLKHVVVSALKDDITRLTEQTTWALLRNVWQREGAPSPSLAAVTTRSIPALRAFLEGERDIVDGRWRLAPAAYERAFTEDSTFTLAYWRYAFAKAYSAETVDSSILSKFRNARGRLPPRDSLLIDSDVSDSTSVRYARTKTAAERFPDYWPAWWTLVERLTHETPLIGTTSRDARAALEHLATVNPRMTSAWTHLFWIALWERDTTLADRVVQNLTALRYDTISVKEQGFDDLLYDKFMAEVIRGGGAPRDTMLREPGIRQFLVLPASIDPMMLGLSMTQYGLGREQVAFSTRVLARRPVTAVAAGEYLAIAVAQAQRGAWDSSLVALDGYVARATSPDAALYAYRMAVIGAWLGALAPDVASARRVTAVRDSTSLALESRAELAWLDGMLAVTKQDGRALAIARQMLGGEDTTSTRMLGRSLAAFADAVAGNRDRAADSLVALERERAEKGLARWASDPHPFLTAVNRLAAGRWLRERGEAGEAARLLTWHEAVLYPLRETRQANAAVDGLAYLERARAADALGQKNVARDYYQRFLVRYDAPTLLHRHLVDEATDAIRRLGTGDRATDPRR